jgi:hypothetical protein
MTATEWIAAGESSGGPPHTVFEPQPEHQQLYDMLSSLYRKLYFTFGHPAGDPMIEVLPLLIKTTEHARKKAAIATH